MNKSDSLTDLGAALSLAQEKIKDAAQNGRGNFGPYSTLTDIREATNKALTAHGLSVCQTFEHDERGDYLETTLLHSSGQWLSGKIYLKLKDPTMQSLGSAITYARRYSLAALLNVAQEDDDGAMAQNAEREKPRGTSTPTRSSSGLSSSGEYKMGIPRNRNFGKSLDEMGEKTVKSDFEYWAGRVSAEGKPATGEVKKFLEHADSWLKAHKAMNPSLPLSGEILSQAGREDAKGASREEHSSLEEC